MYLGDPRFEKKNEIPAKSLPAPPPGGFGKGRAGMTFQF